MATIKTPVAGVSPYQGAAAAEPTALTTTVNGRPSTVAASTIVNGQEALNRLITSSRTGVFQGANVTINLEEQNFSTTNQVTSNTNYPAGGIGEIQFNSGSNSFASNAYFTYDNSNVITPGIRTDGYFYSNGAPFIGGGNAAIGNFVFTGDTMTISDSNQNMNITGNGTGNIQVNSNGNIWTFNNSGNLAFPTGMTIDNEGANTRISQNEGQLKITAGSSNASLKVGWSELEGTGTGNVAQIIANGTGQGSPGNLTVFTGNQSSTTYSWTFDNRGNLTLPANSFAVNYANGNPVVISGGAAGLPLANGTSNINIATANGNVTITANGSPTWTFKSDGNLSLPTAGNILGAVNIIGNGTGNVNVIANGRAWTFAADGNLVLPLAGNIVNYGNTWNFGYNGILTLPGNIIAINYANGNRVTGNITFRDEIVIGTGTSNLISGLYLAPSSSSANANMYLRVRGNINDEPTHIHFDTGNNAYYNQFIGDDNKYIQLANTGNIVINSNDVAGNAAQWTFAADGNLIFPTGNLVITPDLAAEANAVVISSTDHVLALVSNGVNGGVQSVWVEDIANIGTSNIAAVRVSPVSQTGNVQIQTGNNSSYNTWTFDTTGNLTLPGSLVLSPNSIITGAAGSPAPSINGFDTINAITFSASGNITGAYFFGNGSQLTDVGAASVPGQNILPTIQTITVADTSGVGNAGGGGSAFANVTVANTIPVTEYGVIVTAGTVSQKYATGALGSIPGTVKLTFSTGLNSTLFTVYAYVTSNAGTYYSNSATGTSGICLLAGTQIALSDGSHKAIEDITYTDKLLSWDFDRGCYAETTAVWIKRSETGSQYNLLTFSDGTTLRTFDQHRIFNKQAGAFTYPMTDATPVGTVTVNEHGQEITLTNKQVIQDTIEYYNVITDYHMNLFSDSVLTSCRFNNIYPITDMKFVKDNRTLRTRAEFENVEDRFFHGLRLAEQTTDIKTVEWYVNRLLSTEVSTHAELAV